MGIADTRHGGWIDGRGVSCGDITHCDGWIDGHDVSQSVSDANCFTFLGGICPLWFSSLASFSFFKKFVRSNVVLPSGHSRGLLTF